MIFKSDAITSLLIGKDIAATSSVQVVDEPSSSTFIADGEIAVIDELGAVIAGGAITATTNPKIRLVQGTGGPDHKFSLELDSNSIISSSGTSYSAEVEQVTFVGNNTNGGAGAIVVEALADYKLTIIYTHLDELFSEQLLKRAYFITTTSADTQETIVDKFVLLINADEFFGPVAVKVNTGTDFGIRLTGQVLDFESPYFKYNKMAFTVSVSTEGFAGTPVVVQTDADKGQGVWKQVSEMEYFTNGFEGAINRVYFPAPAGFSDVDATKTYDVITIVTADTTDGYAVSGGKPSKGKLILALPVGATQNAALLTTLNAWLATANRPQATISV